MLRLFGEPEANARAFEALTRFLDLLDDAAGRRAGRELDPLALSFQLKLLWLSGYLPHLTSCVECGATASSSASRRARAARSAPHARGALRLSAEGLAGIEELLSTPLADAHAAASASARAATRSRWSPRRTRSTAASGCARLSA